MSGDKPLTFVDLEDKYEDFYVPRFEITVGEGDLVLSDAKGHVSQVTVSTAIEKTNRVTFTLAGIYDQETRTFADLPDAISEGTELDVAVGYGAKTDPVFSGEISSVRPRFPESSAPTVRVVAHDYIHAMDQPGKDESWDASTVPEAAESIAEEYGFDDVETGSSEGGSGDVSLDKIVRDAQTGYEFLRKATTTYDYELFSRKGVLHVRRPPDEETPSVHLEYGRGLRSFQPAQPSGNSDVGAVKSLGIDHRTGETVSGESERGGDGSARQVEKGAFQGPEEAKQRADAKKNRIDREERSSGSTLGLPDLRIGEWIRLTGLGWPDVEGTYYLHEVDHTVGPSGYETEFTVSRPSAAGGSG